MGLTKSDSALLSEFVQGRRAALGELARRYEQDLLGLAVGLLGGRRDLAGDAVQETWVRVIRFGHRFNGRSSFKTWLYRIAINQCRTLIAPTSRSAPAIGPDNLEDEPDDAVNDPGVTAQAAERDSALRRAVERLGEEKRDILLLCYHQGLTHEQSAEILQIPVGTLKSRLSAALKELRDRLSSEMKP